MKKVHFSFEVPHKHLWDFHDDQDFIFALYQNCLVDKYTRYLQEVREDGLKNVWMDNGFNELGQPCDALDLWRAYDLYHCNRLIAPDHIEWPTEKIIAGYRSLWKYLPAENIIVVVRNWEMYKTLELVHHAQHFAVAYRVRREGFTEEEMRQIPRLHFLGLNDPVEVRDVRPLTCDTSMPIKLALRGDSLAYWMTQGCPHIHTADLGYQGRGFFSAELTKEQVNLAKDNIKHLRRFVNGC